MSARALMTQRAQVERDAAADERDRNNQPAAPDWQPIETRIPCFLWSTSEREVDGHVNARVERLMIGVPEDADVTPADRIHGIYDRRGEVLDPHVFRILADQRMGRSHRELTLEIVAGAAGAGG